MNKNVKKNVKKTVKKFVVRTWHNYEDVRVPCDTSFPSSCVEISSTYSPQEILERFARGTLPAISAGTPEYEFEDEISSSDLDSVFSRRIVDDSLDIEEHRLLAEEVTEKLERHRKSVREHLKKRSDKALIDKYLLENPQTPDSQPDTIS